MMRVLATVDQPLRQIVVAIFVCLSSPTANWSAAAEANGAPPKITLPPGFRAEAIYHPTQHRQGSWVAMTIDQQGRIIASDEAGGLYRLTPPPPGEGPVTKPAESIDVPVVGAQGLLAVDDSLYVVVNSKRPPVTSGLYRLTDANGDDMWDRLETLRVFRSAGEHGPHAVVLGPGKKHLYVVCGNHTPLPLYRRSLVPPVWRVDQLLPQIMDPKGHAASITAPGGWIARCDLEGNALELYGVGLRNCYDIAFNRDGELFTFDADMEWDIGTPWYRPTRILHVTSGVDFGWRSGNAKWRPEYIDSLPAAVDVGRGSPTGLAFGYESAFPAKYKQALFAADWSYGRILAVHLQPHESSYRGQWEVFASAMPLAVADMAVRPQDGALYFVVGGRESNSIVYRIVYDASDIAGDDDQANRGKGVAAAESAAASARQLRREIEAFHGRIADDAVDRVWPHLASGDRALRSAARVALEHQPIERWFDRAVKEKDVRIKVAALAAAARVGNASHRQRQMNAALELPIAGAPRDDQLDVLRTITLGGIRLGPITPSDHKRLAESLLAAFPTGDADVDGELARLLTRLAIPTVAEPLVDAMEKSVSHEYALDVATSLSILEVGWTLELRRRVLQWFLNATRQGGGDSSIGYLIAARTRFVGRFSAEHRAKLAELVVQPLEAEPVSLEQEPREFVKEWTVDELLKVLSEKDREPDLERGREMFAAASCFQCHRIGVAGSTIGPDLTTAGKRFGLEDLLRAVVEPNRHISDQYRQMVFEANGRVYVGRITNLWEDEVVVSTNLLDAKTKVTLTRDEIDDQYESDTSMMPSGLLNTFAADEIVDLIGYLRNAGNVGDR